MKKSIFGLEENIAGLLCYVFGFFSGIIILILEKENKFVRFHALQSTIWFLFLAVINWALGFIVGIIRGVPLLGWLFSLAASPVLWFCGVLWIGSMIFLAWKAFEGKTFKLPIIGEVVYAQINK